MQTYTSAQVAQALRDIADSIDDKTITDFQVHTSQVLVSQRNPTFPMKTVALPDGRQSVNICIDYTANKLKEVSI